jgi:CRISPR-associated exonuclease Cas4
VRAILEDTSVPGQAYNDEDLLPISALQHLLYCERQCALIHIERLWSENLYTTEGEIMHERAHSRENETRPGIRIERSLAVRSLSLGLVGQADVVEFYSDGSVMIVEYKRGQQKKNDCDRVQLCAQALCLEEMLCMRIQAGALFYGKNLRRFEVIFDEKLRETTRLAVQSLRDLLTSGKTPQALYDDKKCRRCSLFDDCLPCGVNTSQSVQAYFSQMLQG